MGALHRRDTVERVRGGVVTGFKRSRLVWRWVKGEAIRELDRGAEGNGLKVERFGVSSADVDS